MGLLFFGQVMPSHDADPIMSMYFPKEHNSQSSSDGHPLGLNEP
jgi:hypothetical protein